MRVDRQRDRETDMLITMLRSPYFYRDGVARLGGSKMVGTIRRTDSPV